MKSKFIQCGMIGWCIEVFWTGLHSFFRNDPKLRGFSSLHMFPIYGLASLISPLYTFLRHFGTFTRGIIYMFGFFTIEYTSGMYLKKRGRCPWDYSSSPYHINGVIRLDYAPLWFLTGLFFEKTLRKYPDGSKQVLTHRKKEA